MTLVSKYEFGEKVVRGILRMNAFHECKRRKKILRICVMAVTLYRKKDSIMKRKLRPQLQVNTPGKHEDVGRLTPVPRPSVTLSHMQRLNLKIVETSSSVTFLSEMMGKSK